MFAQINLVRQFGVGEGFQILVIRLYFRRQHIDGKIGAKQYALMQLRILSVKQFSQFFVIFGRHVVAGDVGVNVWIDFC